MEKELTPVPAPASGAGDYLVFDGVDPVVQTPHGKHPGVFQVPMGDDKRAVDARGRAYARLEVMRSVVGKDFFSYAISQGAHPKWINAGLDLMANAIAQERLDMPFQTVEQDPNLMVSDYAAKTFATRCNYTPLYNRLPLSDSQVGVLSSYSSSLIGIARRPQLPEESRRKEIAERLAVLSRYFEFVDKGKGDPEFKPGGREEAGLARLVSHELRRMADEEGEEGRGRVVNDRRARWGKMYLRSPSLAVRLKRAIRALNRRPGYYGGFRYPHRALLPSGDGQCFGHKRSARGGTILVDMSGSMQIEEGDVEQLIDNAPALTMALYGGMRGNQEGQLVVIARKGKMTDVSLGKGSFNFGSGNVVDGPALMWLAKQSAPRIWISDGAVTGIDDHESYLLTIESKVLCRENKIQRFDSIEDAIGKLARKVI